MLRTITVGNYLSIQGVFVRALPDGKVVIRLDGREFAGFPVQRQAA